MKVQRLIASASLLISAASGFSLQKVLRLANSAAKKVGFDSLIPNAIDQTGFNIFFANNELFPQYKLRVKSTSKLLDPDVQQYSGYIDTPEGSHFFFWLFESRNDPKTDPLVLWLNGGPGCSSMMGILFENGPSLIDTEQPKPVYNPHSWNSNATVIYLDQPVFTGFSYNDNPDIKQNTETAAKDIFVFLSLFFEQFPQYKDLQFGIAGESYAGRYIPVFAKEIFDHTTGRSEKFFSESAPDVPKPDFTLDRILIGNGITDPINQFTEYARFACENSYGPLLSNFQCAAMKAAALGCVIGINECYKTRDPKICSGSVFGCNAATIQPVVLAQYNIYDVRIKCNDQVNWCYKGYTGEYAFLHDKEVMNQIGAEREWEQCSGDVYQKFISIGDEVLPDSVIALKYLLDNDMSCLIYAGDADYICNWMGNHHYVNLLEWKGASNFQKAPLAEIKNSLGKPSGELQKSRNLYFYRVYEAGHMVPHDQPGNSLEMLNLFMSDQLDYTKK